MGTYTANYQLYMPTVGEQGWGDLMNGNLTTIDTTMKGLNTRIGALEPLSIIQVDENQNVTFPAKVTAASGGFNYIGINAEITTTVTDYLYASCPAQSIGLSTDQWRNFVVGGYSYPSNGELPIKLVEGIYLVSKSSLQLPTTRTLIFTNLKTNGGSTFYIKASDESEGKSYTVAANSSVNVEVRIGVKYDCKNSTNGSISMPELPTYYLSTGSP